LSAKTKDGAEVRQLLKEKGLKTENAMLKFSEYLDDKKISHQLSQANDDNEGFITLHVTEPILIYSNVFNHFFFYSQALYRSNCPTVRSYQVRWLIQIF